MQGCETGECCGQQVLEPRAAAHEREPRQGGWVAEVASRNTAAVSPSMTTPAATTRPTMITWSPCSEMDLTSQSNQASAPTSSGHRSERWSWGLRRPSPGGGRAGVEARRPIASCSAESTESPTRAARAHQPDELAGAIQRQEHQRRVERQRRECRCGDRVVHAAVRGRGDGDAAGKACGGIAEDGRADRARGVAFTCRAYVGHRTTTLRRRWLRGWRPERRR